MSTDEHLGLGFNSRRLHHLARASPLRVYSVAALGRDNLQARHYPIC